jgi:hypothetical protein
MIIGPIAIGFVAYFHLLFGSELTRIIPSDNLGSRSWTIDREFQRVWLFVDEPERSDFRCMRMGKTQKQLIDQTLEFWQARSPQTLTREDAREIIENVTGFFRILQEWEAADRVTSPHNRLLEKETH